MPRRELRNGKQVADWLRELGGCLKSPGNMTLVGPAALLWPTHDRSLAAELPKARMDVGPVTDCGEVAGYCYEALIGSEFERTHGWHVRPTGNNVLRLDKSVNCASSFLPPPTCLHENSSATSRATTPTLNGSGASVCLANAL